MGAQVTGCSPVLALSFPFGDMGCGNWPLGPVTCQALPVPGASDGRKADTHRGTYRLWAQGGGVAKDPGVGGEGFLWGEA